MGGSMPMFFPFVQAGEITVPSEADYDAGVHFNFSTCP